MRKYVYLFELDSVRKTDAEIIAGQRALYNEIVVNGNVVVLTFNQLIDSRGFFSLLDNKTYYENFIELCEKGFIRISQFGEMRTVAQYLLNTIENNKNKYIYSALPIKSSQRRLISLIKRSITYLDLMEINEYIHRINRNDEELKDLFVEVTERSRYGDSDDGEEEKRSDLSIIEMENILENLYWMLNMVFRISTIQNVYVPPREPSEYSSLKLKDYLEYVSDIELPTGANPLWNEAIKIIRSLNCRGSNDRSLYFRELLAFRGKGKNEKVLQYAEAIVSTCTNYAYEISVCNISKHYNASDLKKDVSTDSSFFKDFIMRLDQYWNKGDDADNRFLQNETNSFIEFTDMKPIPKFEKVIRMISEPEDGLQFDMIPRYEYGLKTQRRKQKLSLLSKMRKQTVTLLFICVLGIVLNIAFEFIHAVYNGDYAFVVSGFAFLVFVLEAIAFFAIGEIVTTLLSKLFPGFLSLSESVGGIVRVIEGAFHLLSNKTKTYVSDCDIDEFEASNKSAPVDFCKTAELKKYVDFYARNPQLFAASSEYPIPDVGNPEVLKRIIRNQEIYQKKYGVIYNSRFNTLLVDPIEKDGFKINSYERIVPTSLENGVVLLTMRRDKFVLIRQFRHAIRKEQLCCPRGFGEVAISSPDNAKKELMEELHAEVGEDPIELGVITADSGLSSGRATVFLMRIEKYNNQNDEGIRETVEMTPNEVMDKIREGKIDDGYTLSALTLYSLYKNKK